MSNNALPSPSSLQKPLVRASLWIACAILPLSAFAQSVETLNAVRLHRRDARQQVQTEWDQCVAARCQSAPDLALLAGYLALLDGEAGTAALRLKSQPPPSGLEAFQAFYLGEALYQMLSYTEAANEFQKALAAGTVVLERRAEARLGLSLAKAGLYDTALHHLNHALRFRTTSELLWARATALEATDNLPSAEADWRTLAVRFPTDRQAQEAIDRLSARHPRGALFTLDHRIMRAHSFAESGQLESALEELSTVPQNLARGSEPFARLALARAQIQYALGRENDGDREVNRASTGPPVVAAEALMLRAKRSLRRDDSVKTRAQMVEIDRRFPRQPLAEEAAFLVVWLDLRAERYAEVVKSSDTFDRRHPRSHRGDEAHWLKSLALLHLQRYSEAHSVLNKLVGSYPKSPLVPQARYWEVRADQLDGKPVHVLAEAYRDVVRTFHGSFYSLLSQHRLREMGEEAPAGFLPLVLDAKASLPEALRLAVRLSSVGLFRDAGEEIRRNVASIHEAPEALQWGLALHELGAFGPAYALASRVLWAAAFTSMDAIALSLLFPRAYRSIVEHEASLRGIDPFFVWAIMRRESGFSIDTVSSANARGLLQVLPRTGSSIAKKLNESPPSPDELFSPEVNIHLGTWYLNELNKRFAHPVTAAAAYNAGPSAVLKWVEASGNLPVDLFVESIPFKETRGYVKQVCADIANYHALYSDVTAPLPFPLELPQPQKLGVDF